MLRVFGCMGLVHVPKEKRDKLQAVAVWAVHLGLARGSKGWLIWDPKSNTIFTTRDAKFMEGLIFKEWSERGRSKVSIPLVIEVGTNDPLLIPIEFSSSSELTEVSHDLGGAEGEAEDVEGLPPRRTTQGKRDAVRGGAKEGEAKERPKRAAHPRDFLKYERLRGPKALLVQEEEDEEEKGAEGEMEQICCFAVPSCFLAAAVPHLYAMLLALEGDPDALDIPIHRTHAEAVSEPWALYWIAAEEAEMASYRSTGTYLDAVSPPGANVVNGKWLYKVKRPPGAPPVFKARYVARGFSQ
ncbi:unnamed protein product [Closterium sp. NIES-54]